MDIISDDFDDVAVTTTTDWEPKCMSDEQSDLSQHTLSFVRSETIEAPVDDFDNWTHVRSCTIKCGEECSQRKAAMKHYETCTYQTCVQCFEARCFVVKEKFPGYSLVDTIRETITKLQQLSSSLKNINQLKHELTEEITRCELRRELKYTFLSVYLPSLGRLFELWQGVTLKRPEGTSHRKKRLREELQHATKLEREEKTQHLEIDLVHIQTQIEYEESEMKKTEDEKKQLTNRVDTLARILIQKKNTIDCLNKTKSQLEVEKRKLQSPVDTCGQECQLCMDVKISRVFLPCGHTTCGPCADRIVAPRVKKCPFCNTLVTRDFTIYI